MGSVSLLKKPKDIPNADNESIITVCRYTAKCTLHTSSARVEGCGWRKGGKPAARNEHFGHSAVSSSQVRHR